MSVGETTTAAGCFITFEGGEGTGKSTQARRLAEQLRARGIDVVETREPGGTPGAEIIRRTVLSGRVADLGPFAEALLMNAARDDHLNLVIRPALAAGRWVVCDRFADSTRAYQGAVGGLDQALVEAMEEAVVGETVPDLTIVLDIPVQVGLARAKEATAGEGRGRGAVDRFEDADISFHEALRSAYRSFAESDAERYAMVDASGSATEVGAAVWRIVSDRLLPRISGGVESEGT